MVCDGITLYKFVCGARESSMQQWWTYTEWKWYYIEKYGFKGIGIVAWVKNSNNSKSVLFKAIIAFGNKKNAQGEWHV